MGGQACVFYGAAQFSKDIDFALLASEENYQRLQAALDELQADRVAVPPFDPAILERGHAIHFRCQAPGLEGLRVDVMTRMRGVSEFPVLWERRTVLEDEAGAVYDLMSVEDLVQAKKTQCEKDWPMIEALVATHYHEYKDEPTPARLQFWFREVRTPEILAQLSQIYPHEMALWQSGRPLLELSTQQDLEPLRAALDAEVRAEQAKDRAYWEPLRKELEQYRREERI